MTVRCACCVLVLIALVGDIRPTWAQEQGTENIADLRGQISRLRRQGKYIEAIPVADRYVALARQLHGEEHAEHAAAISSLAGLYRDGGRIAEAEPLYKRSLSIFEKTLGPEHPDVGSGLNVLGLLYYNQDRYSEAEPLYKRGLAVREKALGSDHPDVAVSLTNLALLYYALARYSEAEPLFKRSLTIREKARGPDHRDFSISQNNLARLYGAQGRYAEAEPLFKRSLTIREKALGPDHLDVGAALNNLAELYRALGRYAEAEPLYKRSLAINMKALKPEDPNVGSALNNLALLYLTQGRYAEAEPLFKRALAIDEKALRPDHLDFATDLNNLAQLYRAQARYSEAEPLFKRSLAIFEKALGPDHPVVGGVLNNLAQLYFEQSDWLRAADFWRRSTSVTVRRAQRGRDDLGTALTGKRKGEVEQLSYRFRDLVKAVHRLASDAVDAALAEEMFETAQWAGASEAAASLAQMATRQAKGDGALAKVVRERQDLLGEWQVRDKTLIAAKSQSPDKRNAEAETILSARLGSIDARIAEIDRSLAKDFPEYATVASPKPLAFTDVQALLASDEALLLFLDTRGRKSAPQETFIWIVTKTDTRWLRIDLGTQTLTERIAALRCGLDKTLWEDLDSADKCRSALGASPVAEIVTFETKDTNAQVLPFDIARAHALYKALFGPAEDIIKGKRLLIVPSGPLSSLPFNVLVTEPPTVAIPRKLGDYRGVAWLGARTAITVLPSVASLKALRQFAKAGHATKPYLGVGNPLLEGDQDDHRWGEHYKRRAKLARDKQECPKTLGQRLAIAATNPLVSFSKLFRGAVADIEEVRQLTPLPETANELCAVARRLNVPEIDVLLGANATETKLKELSEQGRLADYAILHFATHGALSGQIIGSAEPGLILTPPSKDISDPKVLERDDGYLTASEIATLKMDADWVVLSACNTAGAQTENGEALSGMARAFFYAGARALLVSHWAVGSDAAVKLTTRAFAELRSHPKSGRAEALRVSMRELIGRGTPLEAHPSQWAPFVVVGEGAR
jgi:CHAT domain-containing protein/Tfp pilus assembly protein PilF